MLRRTNVAAILLCFGMIGLGASAALAQVTEDFQFRFTGPTAGEAGEQLLITCVLDNNGGDVQGWSLGVCHDASAINVLSVVEGSTTLTVLAGGPPDFSAVNTEIGGVTSGVVISFTAAASLPVGTDYEVLDVSYVLGGAPGDYPLEYCGTLGSPPVSNVVVVGGSSIPPVMTNTTLTILDPNRLAFSGTVGVLGGGASVDVQLTNNLTVQGISCSISYDSTELTHTAVDLAGASTAAEFFGLQATPAGEIAFGIISDIDPPLDGAADIPPGSDQTFATISFSVTATAPASGDTTLSFVDGLGSPPTPNLLAFSGGDTLSPGVSSMSLPLVDFNSFLRSDCNSDSAVDIADGVYLVNFLFAGGPSPTCNDACDANDDAELDVSDAIYVWNYLLLDGAAPPAPFPAADIDPTTGDGLGCDGDGDDFSLGV